MVKLEGRRLSKLIALIGIIVLLAACGPAQTHTVQAGDTLQSIAAKYQTTVPALVELNKDRYPSLKTNPRVIRPGWELDIPVENDVAIEIESLLMRIARTAASTTTPEPAVAAAPTDKINQMVVRISQGINQVRAERHLGLLGMDPNLTSIAQIRSNDMITRNYFSHTDPRNGRVLFQNLLKEQNYSYLFAGENIAEIRNQGSFVPPSFTVYVRYSSDDLADQFVTGWVNSPDHYENIVNPHFSRTGIAIGVSVDGTRVVATQVFSD